MGLGPGVLLPRPIFCRFWSVGSFGFGDRVGVDLVLFGLLFCAAPVSEVVCFGQAGFWAARGPRRRGA